MQGKNQKCDKLESVFKIFLHSCNTPQKVIDVLAHIGSFGRSGIVLGVDQRIREYICKKI
jgi:hypothetical protein